MNPKIGILQEFIGQPLTTHGSQVLRGFEVCSPRPESATAVYGFLQEQGVTFCSAANQEKQGSFNYPCWRNQTSSKCMVLLKDFSTMVQKCHGIWANYNDQFPPSNHPKFHHPKKK